MADNIEPNIIKVGLFWTKKTLTQTPIIIMIPPIEHPILIPYLSNIKLQGADIIVCIIGPNNIVKVIISAE